MALTTVTDTLFDPSSGPVSGTMYITANSQFEAIGDIQVYQNPVVVQINSSGVFSVPLYPNDTATPAGTSYTVHYSLDFPPGWSGQTPTEVWVVPTSPTPIGLDAVRVPQAPTPVSTAAPADATYVTRTVNGSLSNEFSLGTLADQNILAVTVASSAGTPRAATAADLALITGVYVPLPFSRTPGGSLTAATPATVTLTPVPVGVNGADTNHYVYVSAGTGTAEAVLITGGTAVSGAASGTITFTPANSHSGLWTVSSATAGIQEAYYSFSGAGQIFLAAGTYTIYAAITFAKASVTLCGTGFGSIIKAASGASLQRLLQITSAGTGAKVTGLTLDGNRTLLGTAQNVSSNQYALITNAALNVEISLNQIQFAQATGIFIGDASIATSGVKISRNYFHDIGGTINSSGWGTGIYLGMGGATPPPVDIQVEGNSFSDVHNTVTANGPSSAINAATAHYVKFEGNYLKNVYNVFGGQVVSGSSSGADICTHWRIAGNQLSWTTPVLPDTTMGIEIYSTHSVVTENIVEGTSSNGIQLNHGVSDVVISNNVLKSAATAVAISAGGASGALTSNVSIRGNICDGWSWGVATNSFSRQITITGNNLSAVPTPILNPATYSDVTVRNNRGVDDVQGGTLASASTVTPLYPSHVVSGTTPIDTITLPTAFSAYNGLGLTFIPSGAWTTTTGGNIGIATTAQVGKAMTFTYLQSTGKWYPSY